MALARPSTKTGWETTKDTKDHEGGNRKKNLLNVEAITASFVILRVLRG
jgi:hypothetical protein